MTRKARRGSHVGLARNQARVELAAAHEFVTSVRMAHGVLWRARLTGPVARDRAGGLRQAVAQPHGLHRPVAAVADVTRSLPLPLREGETARYPAHPVSTASRSVTGTRPSCVGNPASAAGNSTRRRRSAVAQPHGVRLAGRAQVAQQRHRVGVEEPDFLHVGHRQREPGALQQRGAIAQIGKRRYARRGTAGLLRLRLGQGTAQLRQRAQRRQAGQQQPVRPQRAAQLDQRAGQVVHPVQRQAGDDQVEAGRRERQELLVRRHRRRAVACRHARRQVAAHHVHSAFAQQRRHHAAPADVQRAGEARGGVVQPIEQALGRVAQHVGNARKRSRRPGPCGGARRRGRRPASRPCRAMCARVRALGSGSDRSACDGAGPLARDGAERSPATLRKSNRKASELAGHFDTRSRM